MRIGVFSTVRGGTQRFKEACDKYQGEIELVDLGVAPTDEDVNKVIECEAVIYSPWNKVSEKFWKTLAHNGVRYILTCTAGYDHFDLDMIRKYDMRAAYVPTYSPNAIAEHTVMMVLGLLRSFKEQVHRVDNNDFKMPIKLGREIRKQTIGIIGAGRIGLTTMKCLSGFSPKEMLAYDVYENKEVESYARYVSIDEILSKSDVLIFHCNLTSDNYHMINEETINKLKNGAVLINVARGALFDTNSILNGIKSGKIGGLGLDVIEEEVLLRGNDTFVENPILELKDMLENENVIFTPHSAFYTETAYEDMSNITIENAYEYKKTNTCKYELVK